MALSTELCSFSSTLISELHNNMFFQLFVVATYNKQMAILVKRIDCATSEN